MKKLLIFALVLNITPVYAASCQDKVCIKVYTDPNTGQVIIKANKGKPKVVVTQKPVITTPKPQPTRTWKPRPYTPRPYTPRPKVSKKPATSLSDQLSRLIPNREIMKSPPGENLVQMPIKFSTNTDLLFQSLVSILGVAVLVHLTPSFSWNFGDGTTSNQSTQQIEHTYHQEGDYLVALKVSWSGNWFANGVWSQITGGAIVKTMAIPVTVISAPIKYGK